MWDLMTCPLEIIQAFLGFTWCEVVAWAVYNLVDTEKKTFSSNTVPADVAL